MHTEKESRTTKLITQTLFMAEIYNYLCNSIKKHPFLEFTVYKEFSEFRGEWKIIRCLFLNNHVFFIGDKYRHSIAYDPAL
jgi:hypothetical protein